MIPTQTLAAFPEFGNSSTKVKPDDTKYSAGFVNADVVPYEWVNYLHNKASVGITDLNSGVSSMEKELNAVVKAGGATPSESSNNQVLNAINYLIAQAKSEAILAAHPIGSLYWSSKDTDPNLLFGGTWTRIKDKFILACGDTYKTVGATGGASTVTLTTSNLPSHLHTFTPAGKIKMNAHSHGLNKHTHSFGWSGTTDKQLKRIMYIGDRNDINWTAIKRSNSNYLTPIHISYIATELNSWGSSERTYAPSGDYDQTGWYYDLSHTHSITIPTTATGGNSGNTTSVTTTGSFTGSTGTTSSTGGGSSFSILPPYLVKYCWERTA